ncbi:MAG: ribosome small subunit-dependent GTPase A [Betaproteobacteria bacterium]|nr:ribosome small subunit-dependent GTPase A [Betaproteobacteria bacterium]
MMQWGRVVASHGRHVVIEDAQGERRLCHPRGKKNQAVVGDQVQWSPSEDEGSVESIEPRRNLFYRQDEIRIKSFAANLDQVLVLVAAEPDFSSSQVARALIAAQHAGIRALIALNKQDLSVPFGLAWDRLQAYRQAGITVLPLSLRDANDELLTLKAELANRVTLVLGPSGAGKSTLINRLVPEANAATNIISKALQSGKHTTTSTTWYWTDKSKTTALMDSPGFQEFGLQHIVPTKLAMCMPDIGVHADHCKFHNCSHVHEPDCGVRTALQESLIDPGRYAIYTQLFAELSAPKNH